MTVDLELARKIVDGLNALVEVDRAAVASLIENRVPCNEAMANHPSVQVGARDDAFRVGLLGLLNGVVGAYPRGHGPVSAVYEDVPGQWSRLSHFAILDEDCKQEATNGQATKSPA